jgi:hypothetical protein
MMDGGPTTDGGPDGGPTPTCPESSLGMMTGIAVAMGTTVGAADDTASATCGDTGAEDVAFSWTAPADGTYTFDTLGSTFDTVVTIRMGADCAGAEIDCNDDDFGLLSRIDVPLTAGDTVTVVVDGYDSAEAGDYVLSITQPAADEVGLCADGMDNDRDGDADCADTDCADLPACFETGAECSNTTDDDGDGDIDCADFDCGGWAACVEAGAECLNTMDDDGDGDADCADSDCLDTPACETCPATNLMSMTGTAVATGSTATLTHHRRGTCGGNGAETTFAFTAPSTGSYLFTTAGSTYDTVLYVLAGGCDGFELACNDDATGSTSAVTVDLGAGERVIVVVDAFSTSASGDHALNIAFTASTFSAPSTAGDLVVTEILQNPAGTDTGREWFEITNTTTNVLNLNGCRFQDAAGAVDRFMIGADVLIRPGQHFVLAEGSAPGGFTPSYNFMNAMTLANTDDEVIVECGSPFVEIDRVAYDGGPMFPNPDGATMSLDRDSTTATANDVGASWCTPPLSFAPYDGANLGTPGRQNPLCP